MPLLACGTGHLTLRRGLDRFLALLCFKPPMIVRTSEICFLHYLVNAFSLDHALELWQEHTGTNRRSQYLQRNDWDDLIFAMCQSCPSISDNHELPI